MKISYNWLQDNFEGKLPAPELIKERLIMHAFEVESMDEIDVLNEKDFLFDVKVLPNRAHDCNGHIGIAREVAVLFDLPLKKNRIGGFTITSDVYIPKVAVENKELCPRYIGRVIRNIKVEESPIWLKRRLASIGQKSINNIVDAANYVMFQTGQPLHIFDLDKLVNQDGNNFEIRVRLAKDGEQMVTLDNKTLTLDNTMLVIADESDPLALAGIKGGMKAATTNDTKNIILEAANFTASPIRKTSQKTGVRTDASFRFEHELAPDLASLGMEELTKLIVELSGASDVKVGAVADIYPEPRGIQEISFTSNDIESVLGISMDQDNVEGLLDRFKHHANFDWKKEDNKYVVTIPPERLDLICLHGPYSGGVREDIIEELGRVNGYEKVPFTPLNVLSAGPVNKQLYFCELIRDFFIREGFSEVYNYSLVSEGVSGQSIELRNPLSEEKKYLRTNLSGELQDRLLFNIHNKDLLGVEQIRIFEIGHAFPSYDVSNERVHLAFAVENLSKKYDIKSELERIVSLLKKEIGVFELISVATPNIGEHGVLEFDLMKSVEKIPVPDVWHSNLYTPSDAIFYRPISPFPFASRDIAVFVPLDVTADSVLSLIKENATNLLVKNKLFDQFTKKFEDGSQKTSYAFRLIFQSGERTLTSEEVNAIMDKITNVLNGNDGWKVR